MSEKKLEECSLEEATHVEVNGKVHKLDNGYVKKIHGGLDVYMEHWNNYLTIYECVFPVVGIKPLKEVKPKPIEFEATFVKHDGAWHRLFSLDDNLSYQNCKKAKFRCVQILEEKE